ncbi:MAG: hypothetical protein F6K41_25810 [Symploca sp. SIO3E6]|nr:hypothetical protein [Caldora sp. SIO3E6]
MITGDWGVWGVWEDKGDKGDIANSPFSILHSQFPIPNSQTTNNKQQKHAYYN